MRVRLDTVCEIVMGQAPSGDAYNDKGEGLPLLAGAGDFKNGRPEAKKFTRQITKEAAAGDLILGIRASIGDKVIADRPYCLGRGVAVVRPKDGKIAPRYLWHWLTSVRPELERKAKGATFKQVNRADIGELNLQLPALNEQLRIAAILDKAEELASNRRTVLSLLDRLPQAVFAEMFGDLKKNTNGWQADLQLGDVAELVSGITKGRKLSGRKTREVPYLAVSNVQDRWLNLQTVSNIAATEEEIDRYRLRPGDLLLTEGGDPDKLGRGTLWAGEMTEVIHQNHIFRVRLKSDLITPEYLSWIIGSSYGKTYFLRQAKQTTGIATINMGQLKAFPLLIPPLGMQIRFAARLQEIETLRRKVASQEGSVQLLLKCLQHLGFAGTARATSDDNANNVGELRAGA